MTLCRQVGAPVPFYMKTTSAIRARPRCWVHVTSATPAVRKKDLWLWRENVYHPVNEEQMHLNVQTVALQEVRDRKCRLNDVVHLSTGASAIRLHPRMYFCSRLYEEIIAALSLAFQFHLCGAALAGQRAIGSAPARVILKVGAAAAGRRAAAAEP